MPVLVIQTITASEEEYRGVNEVLDTQGNPPPGLIVHTGGPIGEGELRVVDVWDSAEAFQSFAADRLGPAILQVMGEGAPRPNIEITDLYDVIRGR